MSARLGEWLRGATTFVAQSKFYFYFIERVLDRQNLKRTWKRIRANKGSPVAKTT